MTDFERLGVLYLGKAYDLAAGTPTDELVLYDSRHLTTHAVCVGMTGSGKTGLCIGLLEEAAIDGIPAIAIDPKGDISNLLLTFPELMAADFLPFVDEAEASRQGLAPDILAERVAAAHREALSDWGQDAARIRRFRDACDISIYTPGSAAGRELSLLSSFAAPTKAILEDAELLAGQIEGTVSGLLGLLGIAAAPMRSREHVLLSQILANAWVAGENLDLVGIIRAVQAPAFASVGVIDLETFYPRNERSQLAIALNSLLASPAAGAWTRGEPLDIARLLYTPEGKPKLSILSIAHLSDAQRMFFVTTLLDAMVAWMRQQTGTSSLRALLYMDEIYGYFPPSAEPPSKRPMLLLLKQARAYGLGILLATQNPVDLDYKGLANCGTWFLGRLQTERDKLRVLEGLESARGQSSQGLDRKELDKVLSTLPGRVFVMNDVRDAGPVVFKTRQTLSYLRGPLSREQIKGFMDSKKVAPAELGVATAKPSAGVEPAAPEPSSVASTGESAVKPALPDGVTELFARAVPGSGRLVYQPALWGSAKLHYVNAKADLDTWAALSLLAPLQPTDVDMQWARATDAVAELTDGAANEPESGASFRLLPKFLSGAKSFSDFKKALMEHLYQHRHLELKECRALGLTSTAGEDGAAFGARVALAAREARDAALEKLKQKYDPKFQRFQAQWGTVEAKIEKERAEAQASQVDSFAAVGATVLGALFGRSVLSATMRGGASVVKNVGRVSKQKNDVARAEAELEVLREKWATLQGEANSGLQEVQDEWASTKLEVAATQVAPRKSDIDIVSFGLLWLPFRRSDAGTLGAVFG